MKTVTTLGMALASLLVTNIALADVGEDAYNKACLACHGTGAAGAPKTGDTAAWTARIAKGEEALYDAALKGIPGTAMIAKGGQAKLSDDAVKAAVDYMVSLSK